MFLSHLKLFIASIIPAVATWLLYRFNKTCKLSYWKRQVLYGTIFGAIAILGTEWGIPLNGAIINCRDAAPLCAGFFFGGPSGIIAGLIGGVERWLTVYWQETALYTRYACSVSTFLAGLIAALLRKFMFESKRPKLLLSAVCALLVETLHQSMVYFFHLNEAAKAARIVKVTAPTMILAVTFAVFAAAVVYAHMDGTLRLKKSGHRPLSVLLESRLLIFVVAAFLCTSAFNYKLQTNIALKATDDSMILQLDSIVTTLDKLNGMLSEDALKTILTGIQPGFNGSILILREDGEVVLTGTGVSPDKPFSRDDAPENTPYDLSLSGEMHRGLWRQTGAYTILLAVPDSVFNAIPNISTPPIAFVQILVYGLLFAQIYIMMRRTFVDSLRGVNGALSKIAEGDLTTRVNERSCSEFSKLSDDINATVERLGEVIAEKEAARERELAFARDIQLSSLPHTFPAYPKRNDLDIYAITRPAREVGGDFYDFYFAANGHFYIIVADVSGKGIPAAMFMMRAKTHIKSLTESGASIDEVFRRTNELFCSSNDADMFITAWMADIDMESGKLTTVNAGHNPPAIAKKGEAFSYLKTKASLVLGGMSGMPYIKTEGHLSYGDRIVLYTDGVTDTVNESGAFFGEERFLTLLNENKELSANALVEKVCDDLTAFMGSAEQFDDVTLLVFDFLATERRHEIRFDATGANIQMATGFLEEELTNAGYPETFIRELDVVLDEVLANIVEYAYPSCDHAPVTFRIDFTDEPHGVRLTFRDKGIPFNPLKAPEPDITLSTEDRVPGGLGIFLARRMTDAVMYEYVNGENVLYLFREFRA